MILINFSEINDRTLFWTKFLYTYTGKLSQTNLLENIHVPFSATHPYAAHSRQHFLFFFSLSTPGKCAWNLVSLLNAQILCILDSDVFSYYSSMLSMKRGCFSP